VAGTLKGIPYDMILNRGRLIAPDAVAGLDDGGSHIHSTSLARG
jgi:hypothetical protein